MFYESLKLHKSANADVSLPILLLGKVSKKLSIIAFGKSISQSLYSGSKSRTFYKKRNLNTFI